MVSPKSQIGIAALTSMAGETGFENPYLLRLVGKNEPGDNFGVSGLTSWNGR